MKSTEMDQLKKEFKKIVYLKGQISAQNQHIRKLTYYDKNGSHEKAIIKAMDRKDELVAIYQFMLKGKKYEYWKEVIQKIAQLNVRLKKVDETRDRIIKEFEKIEL